VRVVSVGAVLLVAAVAAIVSYAHMHEVADRAGERWRAWLLPLSVDGLVVAASMVLLTGRRAARPGGRLAWCALLGGVGASLAANVAAAEPSATARIVAAWPALAFAVAFELLLQQRRVSVAEPAPVFPGNRAPVSEPGDEDPPTGRPVADEVSEPVSHLAAGAAMELGDQQCTCDPAGCGYEDGDCPVCITLDHSQPCPVAAPSDPELVAWLAERKATVPGPEPAPNLEPAPPALVEQDLDLPARIATLVREAEEAGQNPPGRRRLAAQLGVTEHAIRTATAGNGAAPQEVSR